MGKQSISDYEKQKSYPTFANLDKIAEYFNATPTQLFGTSKEIELEKSVLESNEYSDKVSEILKAVKYIEHFLHTDGQYLEDLLYLTRGNQLYTFANLDKIAEYFNATPTQLFGTSKEIELEKSVLESNEYSDKVSEILKAVKYIEHFLHTDGQYLEDLLYLTRGNQLYTEDGKELYIDPTSQKRTLHTQYEPGFIEARDKSPLELLIENKELLD
nr:helix-turn-helix transcriptional regulator [Streptococcus sp. Marseille-P7375]